MKTVELLAPAKNYEIAVAAINSGADAIYIGADCFGARENASNSLDIIEKLVNYAHKFYVRVHVTVNTILTDSELKNAISLIKRLYDIGVDAIIVQDMGLLEAFIREELPPIQIHASTQCDNRTLEKVKFFDDIGVSRVILARELSIDKIRQICEQTTCEIETFIHGALCVSYSGQCYMSYANGFRSANKGACAQPCRKKYSLIGESGKCYLKDKYLLSLKDFNASRHIKELVDAGVNSFKIEGRLKDENYVKNVVLYYNNVLNTCAARSSSGRVFTDFAPDLNKTFNRNYTDYFLLKRTDCFNFLSSKFIGESVGFVSYFDNEKFKIDRALNPQDGVCYIDSDGNVQGFLVNKIENGFIYPNKNINLKKGVELYRNYDSEFIKNLSSASIVRKIGVSFILTEDKIFAIDENSNKVELGIPIGEKALNPEKNCSNYEKQLSKLGDSDYYLENISINSVKLPFLPVSEINKLRRNLLNLLTIERINNYPKQVQKHIGYGVFPINKIDYRGNILNTYSKAFYEKNNCKVCEDALEKSKIIPSGIELMRTKHCLKYVCKLCGKNTEKLFLQDDRGKKYPLLFDCKNCEMAIIQP